LAVYDVIDKGRDGVDVQGQNGNGLETGDQKSARMKLALCLLITSVALVQASIFGSKPDLEAKATWGETNPFAQVTNGIQNKLFVTLTNHAKKDLTVRYVSGSFHERTAKGAERLVKNVGAPWLVRLASEYARRARRASTMSSSRLPKPPS
jgi:hypothetical protein